MVNNIFLFVLVCSCCVIAINALCGKFNDRNERIIDKADYDAFVEKVKASALSCEKKDIGFIKPNNCDSCFSSDLMSVVHQPCKCTSFLEMRCKSCKRSMIFFDRKY